MKKGREGTFGTPYPESSMSLQIREGKETTDMHLRGELRNKERNDGT